MKKLLLSSCLFCLLGSIYGQLRINPEIQLGCNFTTGDFVPNVHPTGFNASGGISFQVWKSISIKPLFQYRYYRNSPEKNVKETLEILVPKLSLSYKFYEKEKQKLLAESSLGYSKFKSNLKAEDDNIIYDELQIFNGESIVWDLGLRYQINKVYLILTYQRLNTYVDFNSELIEEIEKEINFHQVFVVKKEKLDMSSLLISIGHSW